MQIKNGKETLYMKKNTLLSVKIAEGTMVTKIQEIHGQAAKTEEQHTAHIAMKKDRLSLLAASFIHISSTMTENQSN